LGYVGFGGNPESTVYYNDFGIYDPSNNSWKQFSVPGSIPTRTGCIGFSISNIGYVGVGLNSMGILTDFWSFVPEFTPEPSNFNSDQNNNSQSLDLQIYPNPTSKIITVKASNSQNATVSIYNAKGVELIQRKIGETSTQIDISNFTAGIYYLKIFSERISEVRKIIKE